MRVVVLLIGLLAGCDRLLGLDKIPEDGGTTPSSTWREVATGWYHTCAIQTDDSLWCWGDNSYGQTGAGQFSTITPARTQVPGDWQTVAVGPIVTCGIRRDHSLWCWGNNVDGVLANGTQVPSATPVQIEGAWTAVAIGFSHICAIHDDMTMSCWGRNDFGQLGIGSTDVATNHLPTLVAGGATAWRAVAAGANHTCAIDADSGLWCWGDNFYGELGDGNQGTGTGVDSPKQIPGEQWAELALGFGYTCGRTVDGKLRCWGYNGYGNLGRADTVVPAPLDGDSAGWVQIAASWLTTCARRDNGDTKCWGYNAYSQVGLKNDMTVATALTAVPGAWKAVAVGIYDVCAIDEDDHLSCRGGNGRGQLGDGGASKTTPVQIAGTFTAVAAGSQTVCARDSAMKLSCAGYNTSAVVGDGTNVGRKALVPVGPAMWSSISVGTDHACGVSGMQLYCWGDNSYGRLGDGTTTSRNTPTLIAGMNGWTQVAAGRNHSCGLVGGIVYCWGSNDKGQVGANTATAEYHMPTPIAGGGMASVVVTGERHTCAIAANPAGLLACWGYNGHGQLGTGTTTDSITPALVSTPEKFIGLTAGTDFTCGITTGNQLACWGANAYGQLGVGDVTDRLTPTITGPALWQSVDAGANHACAIAMDGTLWCWGFNARGQLGDGTYTSRTSPTQVGSDTDWTEVSAGTDFTCALKKNGSLWCWGANDNGQIPDDTAWTPLMRPVQ